MAHPTYFQSIFASFFLIALSTLFIPITLLLTLLAFLYSSLKGTALDAQKPPEGIIRKTVLITGARTNKALCLARSFKRAKYRVILAEEKESGTLCCARFSRAADAYYDLPKVQGEADNQAYIDAIKALVIAEDIDAWIPCSGGRTTTLDAETARHIHEMHLGDGPGNCCDTFIQHPDLAATLHFKDQLGFLLNELECPTPESRRVTSIAQAADFLHAPHTLDSGKKYLLKGVALHDLGQDFTLLPLATRQDTLAHLRKMPIPISHETPFLLQRFLKGREYCTHVAARQGEITAFVACRSSDFLMRYVDITTLGEVEKECSDEIEDWVKGFLKKWKEKLEAENQGDNQKGQWETELTGHFSFDFIKDDIEGILYPLECNVRANTAVVLLSETPTLADSYLLGLSDRNRQPPLSRPPPNARPRSWITHALPLSLIQTFLRLPFIRFISPSFWVLIHPGLLLLLPSPSPIPPKQHRATNGNAAPLDPPRDPDPTLSPSPTDNPFSALIKFLFGTFLSASFLASVDARFSRRPFLISIEQDPYWDWDDPVPFFVLAHVTWVWMFMRLALTGRGWSRVNVSTGEVFEC